MKKSDMFFNIGIAVLFVGIVFIVIFKFIIKEKPQGLFAIRDLSAISLRDLSGNKIPLADVLDKEEETFCLLFELTNCYSCIVNGIEDLKKVKNSGSNCIAVAVHDLPEEVAGWSRNHDFSPFFVLKKSDFYKHIQSSTMPVFFSIKKGKVEGFRFITP